MALNKLEAMKILSTFEAAYPAFYAKQTVETKKMAAVLMADIMADYDYEMVTMAARKAIVEDTAFPPSIGHLQAICNDLKKKINLATMAPESLDDEKLPAVRQYMIREASKEKQKMLNMLSQGGKAIEDHSRV